MTLFEGMQMTEFSGKRVLITGGLGFIGSNLAIRLVGMGADVTIVDSLIPEYGGCLHNIEPVRDKVRLNICDVRDPNAMTYLVRNQQYLFNLAGQTSHLDSMTDPFADLDINARAQLSILEACRKYNPSISIVFAGTRQVYGKPRYLPVDEQHPLDPVDVNGINKMAGEWYHLLYSRVYGVRSTVLRLTNTYGPRMRIKDDRQTFLGSWIRDAIAGEPLTLYGTGSQLRDYTYVDDAVEALMLAACCKEASGSVINLGGDRPYTLRETAELLTAASGSGGGCTTGPFPAERQIIDIGDYYASWEKAGEILGWKPHTSLADGLTSTLAYYRNCLPYYLETDTGDTIQETSPTPSPAAAAGSRSVTGIPA